MTSSSIRQFRGVLRRLEAEIGTHLSDETECCGVTLSQCHVLLEADQCASASLGEIADRLIADKGAVSRTVDSLVRDGFASREENPENRRKVSISLTERGKAKAEYINSLCDESYGKVLALIPESKHGQILESVAILAEAMARARMLDKGDSTCSCAT